MRAAPDEACTAVRVIARVSRRGDIAIALVMLTKVMLTNLARKLGSKVAD